MSCTGALKSFFCLCFTINWGTQRFLCAFAHTAFIVDKAVFKAVGFWLPGNKWRTHNQTDGCSSYTEQDRQMAVCPFREKLWILRQRDFESREPVWTCTDIKTDTADSLWFNSLWRKQNTPIFGVNHWAQLTKQTPIHHRFLLPVLSPPSHPPLAYLPLSLPHLSLPFCPPPLPNKLRTAPPPSAPSSPEWALFVWVSQLLFSQDSRPQANHRELRHLRHLLSPLGMTGATLAPPHHFITLFRF